MRSIQLQSSLSPWNYAQIKHMRRQFQTPKLLPCPSSSEQKRFLGTSRRQHFRFSQGEAKAMLGSSSSSTYLVLGLTSPEAKSPDIWTLILTSATLLVLYFLANFIVPDLISKYFQFDKVDENQEGRDNDF